MGNNARFNRLVDEAVAQSISGWDFSFVDNRIIEFETSWDYRRLVEQQIPHATSMIDMCTGGGEFLNTFGTLPPLTFATEGFPPNVDVAKKRLEKRGVRVISFTSDDELPLPSDTFDLVINRHGAYSPKELLRVTQSAAVFLTQQVGSDNASGLNEALHASTVKFPEWRLDTAIEGLASQGFSISRCEEEFPAMSFKDIGAVVFYLKAIPWQIPEFNPENFREELLALHNRIDANGPLEVKAHRFLIEARRD